MTETNTLHGEVVDLFCGVGALSHGLYQTGFKIVSGFDLDERCKFAFESNNDSTFYTIDVGQLSADQIRRQFSGTKPTILAGCAPCQPFSSYKRRYEDDPRWTLVSKFADLAVKVKSDFVTMENVPALVSYKSGTIFKQFCQCLTNAGYNLSWSIVKCEKLGIPQRRRRLVLVAARDRKLPQYRFDAINRVNVRQAIGSLRPIQAGRADSEDRFHVSQSLTEINLKRIRASLPGGTWRDWPNELLANCHRRRSGKTYPSVYARMSWDEPSPTITTQCYGYGNGRFGHPSQDRAISLREAALLQTFPIEYMFLPEDEKPTFSEIGRWIGNAVPVLLAKNIGEYIKNNY